MRLASALAALVVAVVAALGASGCSPPSSEEACPADATLDSWHAVAALRDGGEVRLRGFAAAAPAGAAVLVVDAEGPRAETTADADGAFELRLESAAETLEMRVGDDVWLIRPRAADVVERCLVGAASATGTLPNDVQLSRCDDETFALVPASADGALDAFPLAGGAAVSHSAFELDAAQRGANPWAVAPHPSANLASTPSPSCALAPGARRCSWPARRRVRARPSSSTSSRPWS
jgi:hypothetical protein